MLVFEVAVGEGDEFGGVAAGSAKDFGFVVEGLVDVASVFVVFGEGAVGVNLVGVDGDGVF